ncbi:cytochrome c biogenesis protein CcdA [Candidatus Woesearchaeota archaeon]|nr:cytochrome c biogenesis protein CcdA [Candidatus Woesearchaeota archaeon]
MRKSVYLVPFAVIFFLFALASFFRDSIDVSLISNLRNISFAIAFLGGVMSIFSPCSIAVVPAFVSYAFKERRDVGKMTLAFFVGFSLAFVTLGLLIAYLGKISFVYFQNTSSDLILAIGFLLVIFGFMAFLGRGFTFISIGMRPGHDVAGVFLFGILFAVGWSACSGPIIAGIISVAAAFSNYAYSALLLFFYSLGVAVPLFSMAFAYDRYNLAENPFVKGRYFGFSVLGRDFMVHSTNAVAGIMLAGLGLLFIVYRGTTFLTGLDLFGRFLLFVFLLLCAYVVYELAAKRLVSGANGRHVAFVLLFFVSLSVFMYINSNFIVTTVGYSELFDRIMLQNSAVFNVVGVVLLAFFVFLILRGKY